MKELDFDELDRAVNSLMADVKPDSPQLPGDDRVRTVSIPPSEAPTPPATPKATAPSVLPALSPPPPAARRGGRFMDVMHPSADMKKPETPPKVSREGTPLIPTEPFDSPKTPSLPAEPPAAQPEKAPTPAAASSEWPDPLDLPQFSAANPSTSSPPSQPETPPQATAGEAAETSKSAEQVAPDTSPGEPAPLTSPFLPDAKVEKRPLGGSSPAAPPAEVPTGEAVSSSDQPDEQLPPAPQEAAQPLPEELQNDLVAIEAGTSNLMPPGTGLPADNAPTQESQTTKVVDAGLKEPEPTVPKGPVSIPPQYKEEPSTGDQHSGAIYDTAAYHQPLTHPVKKKSGWLWVVWILLILALGGAVGAALYFFGII